MGQLDQLFQSDRDRTAETRRRLLAPLSSYGAGASRVAGRTTSARACDAFSMIFATLKSGWKNERYCRDAPIDSKGLFLLRAGDCCPGCCPKNCLSSNINDLCGKARVQKARVSTYFLLEISRTFREGRLRSSFPMEMFLERTANRNLCWERKCTSFLVASTMPRAVSAVAVG